MSSMNLLHPEGMKRQPADTCIFIYDEAYFKSLNYGKHKLKCLLDLCLDQQVDVYVGGTEEVLNELIRQYEIETLITQTSFLPRYQGLFETLKDTLHLQVIEDPLKMSSLRLTKPSYFSFFASIEDQLKVPRKPHD